MLDKKIDEVEDSKGWVVVTSSCASMLEYSKLKIFSTRDNMKNQRG